MNPVADRSVIPMLAHREMNVKPNIAHTLATMAMRVRCARVLNLAPPPIRATAIAFNKKPAIGGLFVDRSAQSNQRM